MKKLLLFCLIVMPLTIFASDESIKPDQGFNLLTYMPWIITIISLCITAWQVFTTKQVAKLQNEQTLKIAQLQNEHALRLAKLNHNSIIVANNRMQYLTEIRKTATEMICIITKISELTVKEERGEKIEHSSENIGFLDVFTRTSVNILLLLNPNDNLTIKIRESINLILESITKEYNPEQFNIGRNRFMTEIQEVLKIEWERIKTINAAD